MGAKLDRTGLSFTYSVAKCATTLVDGLLTSAGGIGKGRFNLRGTPRVAG